MKAINMFVQIIILCLTGIGSKVLFNSSNEDAILLGIVAALLFAVNTQQDLIKEK